MGPNEVIDAIELSIRFFDRFDFLSLINVNKEFKSRLSQSENVVAIIRSSCHPCSFIPHFWERTLSAFKNDVVNPIQKEDYCFEFHDDDTNDIVPHYHGNRLMKDEYIDGEISRDVCRTFPNHLFFRHKELGGQGLLESVLRKVSDNYFGLGYCQGMNYVVGTIMISLIDPELNGYYSDNDTDELQMRIQNMDSDDIKLQMYEITAILIDRLQMMRLWGYGFPDIPLYVFVLRQFLQSHDPALLIHFDEMGFELSILITKWFIPLFSNSIPFFILFRIWDFIFVEGIPGLFRIVVSLLVYLEKDLLKCDLIQISDFLNSIGKKRLVKEKEIQLWFDVVRDLHDITQESYSVLVSEFNTRCTVTMSSSCIAKRNQLTADIEILLNRIKEIHDEETFLRNDLRNNLTDQKRYRQEYDVLSQQKEKLSEQIDSLVNTQQPSLIMKDGYSSDKMKDVSSEEMKKLSSQLIAVKDKLKEVEDGLSIINQFITEGIENLEDINTKRLSLRIQLSQLIKEKSLLLFSTVIK